MQSQSLSKSAQKKQAKQERHAALKQVRRQREREARKEKNRIRAEKRAAGQLDDEQDAPKKRRKLEFGGTVVVDLAFDDLMLDKEINSLTSQLAYTYSANRNASFPFSLKFTSLHGRTKTRLDNTGDASYTRWQNTSFHPESYTDLPDSDLSKLVYLTADTDDELTDLSPDDTYIIGGIVDHNRYKNLCLNKAKESGIRTARLPIGTYLAHLPTRKVLTVNQVFEILLKWVETRDWEQALYAVIPKRKFQQGGDSGTAGGSNVSAEVEEGQGPDEGGDGVNEVHDGAEHGDEDEDEAADDLQTGDDGGKKESVKGAIVIDEAAFADDSEGGVVLASTSTPVADPPRRGREEEENQTTAAA